MKYLFILFLLFTKTPLVGQKITKDVLVNNTSVKGVTISISKDSIRIGNIFNDKILSNVRERNKSILKCALGTIEIENNVIRVIKNEEITFIRIVN